MATFKYGYLIIEATHQTGAFSSSAHGEAGIYTVHTEEVETERDMQLNFTQKDLQMKYRLSFCRSVTFR